MPTHFLSAKWDAEQRWGAEWSFQKWPKQTFTCLTCEHGWKIHQHQKSPIDQDWHKPPGQHLRRPTSSTRGQAPKIDPYKIPMSIKLLVLDKAGCRPGARGHGFAIADVAASPPFVGAMRILGPTPNKNKNNKHEARGIGAPGGSTANPKVQQVKKIDDITTTLRNHPTFSYSTSLHLAMEMVYRSTPLHKHKGSAGNPNKIIEDAHVYEKKTYRRNHATSSLQ